MKINSDTDICCYPLDVTLWQEKTFEWNEKLFLQDQVLQFMHIPLNMSSVVKRMFSKIEAAKAEPETKDFLMLAHDPSPWKSDIFMTVTKNVPDGKMAKLSGTYISKVFDGPYNHVPKWIKEMDEYLKGLEKKPLKYYFHYAYCPKCAKKYGHNYCIAFVEVE